MTQSGQMRPPHLRVEDVDVVGGGPVEVGDPCRRVRQAQRPDFLVVHQQTVGSIADRRRNPQLRVSVDQHRRLERGDDRQALVGERLIDGDVVDVGLAVAGLVGVGDDHQFRPVAPVDPFTPVR